MLVRVRFPDGWTLQGTFSVYENICQVLEFVTDCLSAPLPFLLLDSATGARLQEEGGSLLELGLVPASLLNFTWHPDIEQDIASQGNASVTFLRPELKQ